jgi:hypothetical protein
MCENPVATEGILVGAAADTDPDRRSRIAVGRAGSDRISVVGYHKKTDMIDWKPAEIDRYGGCGSRDPVDRARPVQARRTVGKHDVDKATADRERQMRLVAQSRIKYFGIIV